MKLIDPRDERRDALLAAMEKRDQAVARLAEARDAAAKLSYGITRGTSTDAIAEAERAVTAAIVVYRAASLELIDLIDGRDRLPPAPVLNLAVI